VRVTSGAAGWGELSERKEAQGELRRGGLVGLAAAFNDNSVPHKSSHSLFIGWEVAIPTVRRNEWEIEV
jgi:hypothetical protein